MDFLAGSTPALSQLTTATTTSTSNNSNNAEKQLRPLLFDEAIHVLSTFELNQIASLTFNDVTRDDIFELIERVCRKPLEHTPLSIQKALVVTKHILIYGQEKTVNHAYALQDYFKALTNFNTVLLTQQQGGAMAFFQSIQGGGVDKGGPVRQAATDLVALLSNIHELQRIRNASASQNSLVPVGDDQVAFVTDQVRQHILKQRIEKERQVQIKSNLAKADNGFGAGYAASNGKSVVGAAHGIEEMIKMAKIQKKTFSDDANSAHPPGYMTEEERILEELKAEVAAAKAAQQPEVDLLGVGTDTSTSFTTTNGTSQEVDLLGFGEPATSSYTPNNNHQSNDLLGGMGLMTSPAVPQSAPDPFGLGSTSMPMAMPSPSLSSMGLNNFSGNGYMAGAAPASVPAPPHDPFSSIPLTAQPPSNNNSHESSSLSSMNMMPSYSTSGGGYSTSSLVSGMATMGLGGGIVGTAVAAAGSTPLQQQQQQLSSTTEDRFAALDALASSADSGVAASANSVYDLNASYPTPAPTSTYNINNHNNNFAVGMMPTLPPAPLPPMPDGMVAPGTGHVAKSYGDVGTSSTTTADEDNPWVMGGTAGSGLDPVGPAPGTAPPPPPPAF